MEASNKELSHIFRTTLGEVTPILDEIIDNYRPETLDIDVEFTYYQNCESIPLQIPKTLIDLVKETAFEENPIFSSESVRKALEGFEEQRGVFMTPKGCKIRQGREWWGITSVEVEGWVVILIFQSRCLVSLSVSNGYSLPYQLESYDMNAFLSGNYYLYHIPMFESEMSYSVSENVYGIDMSAFDKKIIPKLRISRIFG